MRRIHRIAPLLLALIASTVLSVGSTVAIAQEVDEARSPKELSFEHASDGPVYIVPVDGMIDNMLWRYINRAIGEAEANEASLVILHMDTFGGLVEAADNIRKRLLNASVPTVAFVDKNAASAGALISYAADRIVMVPGASIGAATVVDGSEGEAMPDKYQSYMRGLMRSTAEARGRDPKIAEAMVDQSLELIGISPAGQVLTLSSSEALGLGVADAVLANKEAVIDGFGRSNAEVVQHHASRSERVLRFFGSPVIQSILMLMMLGGLYFELQTPGVGFAGAMAALGATLFFAPHYMLGLVDSWEFVLFVIGIILILAEIFLLPGFGVAGILGIVLTVFSLGASLIGNVGFVFPSGAAVTSAISTMAVTLVLLIVLIFSLSRNLPHSERFNRLVLTPELSSATGYTSADENEALVGRIGRALTPLRPSGTADIDGERIDVITSGEYVPSGATVRVNRVRGSRVEVRLHDPVAEGTSSPSIS